MELFKFAVIVGFVGFCQGSIDSKLVKALRSGGRADVLVNFAGENVKAIKSTEEKSFESRLNRIKELNLALRSLRDHTQGPVKEFLKGKNVRSVNAFPQVSRIQLLPTIKLSPRLEKKTPKADTVEWGVAKIEADQVWSNFNTTGQGVVVANIDTGVRVTHEALAGNFRSDHGWFDPYDSDPVPTDSNGHGTHTMGTIAGSGGIGVAPGATWIACRGCGSDTCDAGGLLACGQFMLSPTNPDGTDPRADLVPDVVSNSWGSNIGGDDWYNATVEAWRAAGIMHAFAIGNSGPACRSGGSPGDQPTTFSVGSTDKNDRLSVFSSKGPSGPFNNGYIKPDISAPGSNIRSAWYEADDSYNTISGTSMATPHVAGVMALMLSAQRIKAGDNSLKLDFNKVVENIEKTANQNLTVVFPNYRCDGVFYGRNKYPNNQFGYGRISALGAVNATLNSDSGSEQPTKKLV